ncbi:MAG: hypothetical protein ACLQE9_03205 [Roseiarcus sp.]
MGMLFNTDATIEILAKLNETFSNAGLARLKVADAANAQYWSNLFQTIGTTVSGNVINTYDSVAVPLGIDLEVGSSKKGLKTANWQAFLKHVDNHFNNAAGTGDHVSTRIGKKIATAITQTTNPYAQVEFFAVPSPKSAAPYVSVSFVDYSDPNSGLSLIVLVNTCTVDELITVSASISGGRRARKGGDKSEDEPAANGQGKRRRSRK